MADEIVKLLEDNKLRQEVIKTIQSVWNYAGTLHDNPDEDMEKAIQEIEGTSLWEEAWWRAETYGEVHKIEQAFDEYIVQKMSKPHRLTLKELFEVFLDLAKPDEQHYGEFESFDSEDCNKLYMIFVNHVKNHILSYRSSDPFSICLVTESEGKEWFRGAMSGYKLAMKHMGREGFQSESSNSEGDESEKPLWQKNNVSVSLLRGADLIGTRLAGKKLHHILAVIEGNISTLACRDLQSESSRILPTAIRSADLLQSKGFGKYKEDPTIRAVIYEREIKGLPWGDEKLIENGKPLIRQYLDAFYSEPTKKDSFDRRIHNAVRLLIESDNQPNNAVGLALSITAIEALLGEKGEGIAAKLPDNVAVLLEPDLSKRQNATVFITDLYKTRSRALHGELVEAESEVRINARHLAAAVLSGVISRRNFLRRSGYEPESPQELLKELRKSRFSQGQPIGVEEYNIRELWRN